MSSNTPSPTLKPDSGTDTTGNSLESQSDHLDVPRDAAPVRTRLRLYAILLGLYLSIFIAGLDETIVATALPTISSSLHSNSGYFWIGGAYLLAVAAASPLWSKFSDIWGRKPAFLAAITIFGLSSILAALSVDIDMLIAGRALQGTAAGGLLQLVPITIADLFSQRERALYLGIMEVVWSVSGGLGPIFGGVFAELVSWRWCFWINVPICAAAFVLLLLFLDVHNPRTKLGEGLKAVDWFGTLTILGVTLMLLLGLDFGGVTFPWNSATVICLIIFGSLLMVLFLVGEAKLARYPLVPLGIFKTASNKAIFAVTFAHGMTFMAGNYFLPLYFQSVKQVSPLRSGVLVLPMTIVAGVSGFATGVLVHRTGRYRELIWIGMFLLTLGTGLYIMFDVNTSVAMIAGFEVIAGLGSGAIFLPPMIAIQSSVPQNETAMATATYGFIQNIAVAVSVILGGVVFQNSSAKRIPQLREAGLSETLIAKLSGSQAAANSETIKSIASPTQRLAVEAAFAWSLRNIWIMFTCVSFLGLIASLFVVKFDLSNEHTETLTGVEKMTRRRKD